MTLDFVVQTAIILVFCILCSLQDFKYRKVSKILLAAGCITQLVFLLIFARQEILVKGACGAVYAFVLFLIRQVTKKGLGMADVFFGLFQGLCLLPLPLCLSVVISCVTGIIFGFIVFKNKKLPFIPFMSFGLIISFLFSF